MDLPDLTDDVSYGSRQRLMDRGEFGCSRFMLPIHSNVLYVIRDNDYHVFTCTIFTCTIIELGTA